MATLFSLLDSDRDGLISPDNIDLSELGEKQLSLLTPIFEALQNSESAWNYESFYEQLEQLMSGMTVEEKHYVLKGGKRPETAQQVDFKPRLSAKSHVLAEKKRASTPGDIYSRGMKSLKETAEFREASKAALEDAEMKQCTFNPFKTVDESKSEGRKSRTSERAKAS